MITMNYLSNSEGIITKNFIVREKNDGLARSFCSRFKDEMARYGGILLLERKLFDGVYFLVVSFDNRDLMTAWEATLGRRDIMQEINSTKVLIIKDSSRNDAIAISRCQKAKDLLAKCKGTVLHEIKVSEGEYRLVLFFSDEIQMKVWEASLGVC